jgi:hypothetical protein
VAAVREFTKAITRVVAGDRVWTRGKPLVITVDRVGVTLKERGRRQSNAYGPIPWTTILGQAVWAEANRRAREKALKKRERRLARAAAKGRMGRAS